ncbi:uncharacterized protein LY89DRAFT_725776 [Mollisia scopiformis]|uniref:Uncharacterized protein n=1 Tax=Mollisia scopiformis TaxID=149040 RepID=A0A132B4D0_MOLSC|nr:uncharacterized protein LY89DRAFT_725776 [Mollisia scopiformis]KUJ07252.1 hypothetical protein LY89DRAFT_725776 [Mollisia scopiformis]
MSQFSSLDAGASVQPQAEVSHDGLPPYSDEANNTAKEGVQNVLPKYPPGLPMHLRSGRQVAAQQHSERPPFSNQLPQPEAQVQQPFDNQLPQQPLLQQIRFTDVDVEIIGNHMAGVCHAMDACRQVLWTRMGVCHALQNAFEDERRAHSDYAKSYEMLYTQHQNALSELNTLSAECRSLSGRNDWYCRQIFFPPKDIEGVGIFQDAGPLQNDPLIAALAEAPALFPAGKTPDFVVSLGTGRTPVAENTTVTPGNFWRNRASPRLWRMFSEKMRDRDIRRLYNEDPRYHRVDFEFSDVEPRLENIKQMRDLQSTPCKGVTIMKAIDNIARSAISCLFYFKLETLPVAHHGATRASGFIRCWIRQSDPAFQTLIQQLTQASAAFYLNERIIPGDIDDPSFWDRDGNFSKHIELHDGKFSIKPRQGVNESCNISGSPYCTEKLIAFQGLNAVFGRADRRKRKRRAKNNTTARQKRRLRY